MKAYKLSIALLCLVAVLAFASYYQHNELSKISKRLDTLEKQNVRPNAEQEWLIDTVGQLFLISFHNYEQTIRLNSAKFLSEAGEKSYKEILQKLNLVHRVIDEQGVASAYMLAYPTGHKELTGSLDDYFKAMPEEDIETIYNLPVQIVLQVGSQTSAAPPIELIITVVRHARGSMRPYTISNIRMVEKT